MDDEQETIILYNQKGDTVNIYTHDPELITALRLAGFHLKNRQVDIPKKCLRVTIRKPLRRG